MSWSNLEGAAGTFDAGRNVTPGLTEVDARLGAGGRHVTPGLTVVAGLAGAGGRHVTPELAGAALGALKAEGADVIPRITGADVRGALKAEGADVVPRITGSGGTTSGPLNGEGGALRSGAFVVLAGIAARLAWFLALISSRRALSLAAASAFAFACCSWKARTAALFFAMLSRVF